MKKKRTQTTSTVELEIQIETLASSKVCTSQTTLQRILLAKSEVLKPNEQMKDIAKLFIAEQSPLGRG
ncbi:hypothetical protein F0562_018757 [Nyssa sinensis]|uniref:Uncharacterized protein n=1 Tax=Nyssa sinensis TaxID=561372 RepID=A0A5J4ZD14_9ASTE|nr:hypothetical protein F0562_018757 [Nyssa sinensis]